MATDNLEDVVQAETKDAQDIAHHNLTLSAEKCWKILSGLPLHTHLSAMKMLEAQTEHRFTAMKLEAEDRQRKAQAEFEAQRKKEHAALQEAHANAKPVLVTQ